MAVNVVGLEKLTRSITSNIEVPLSELPPKFKTEPSSFIEISSGVQSGTVIEREPRKPVIRFNDIYLKIVLPESKLRNKDVRNEMSRFNQILEHFGDRDMSLVDKQAILDFFASKNWTSATRNRYLSLLIKIFDAAIENGFLEVNPCRKIKRFKENNRSDRVFNPDEIKFFLICCLAYPDKFQAFALLLALFTGARIGNVISIERAHVSNDGFSILLPDTKSGRSQRLYLSDVARRIVQRLLSMSNGRYLFPSKRSASGHIAIPRACWNSILKQMREAGVLSEHAKIHSLRHSFATKALEATGNLQLVSTCLGHSSVDVTTRYTHLQSKDQFVAANGAADLMVGGLSKDVFR